MTALLVFFVVAQIILADVSGIKRFSLVQYKIQKISNCMQSLVQNGDESVGLPILDYASIDEKTINLNAGRITIRNFRSQGGSRWSFPVQKVSAGLTKIPIRITVIWPEAFVHTDYDVNLNIFHSAVKGVGHLNFHFRNLSVAIEMNLLTFKRQIQIRSIKPHIDYLKLDVTDLQVEGVDRTKEVNDFAENFDSWMDENMNEISEYLSKLVEDIINKRVSLGLGDLRPIVKRFKKCVKFF